jgi:predicted AlkP superfamily phosphohydrolase/phosphomutase
MSGNDHRRRVLLLGLDSADAELIEQWCEQGHLPALSRLREEGLWSRLGTTAEVMHVSAWPSIYTSTTPGHHGLYHAYQIRAGEQRIHRTLPKDCAQPPFWQILDRAGRKCIVMDAFMATPVENFGGIQILEYGTWTWFGEPLARPEKLWRDIIRQFGAYPAPEHTRVTTVPNPRWFRDRLLAGAEVKSRVVRWLLREHEWDLAFITFGEPHGAGHYLWHVSDPSYPSHPLAGIADLEKVMLDVYAAVDRAIGEIVAAVGDSTTIFVTSGDGMGPNYAGCHLMPALLQKLGLFSSASVGAAADASRPAVRGSLLSGLRQAIPLSVRQSITRCLPRSVQYRLSMKWVNADIDWARSQAFCIPNANEGYVRINLAGREPQGIVPEGSSYDDLIAHLRHECQGLVNPVNGSAAATVFATDEVFPGAQRRHLPDLVVTWHPDARVLGELRSTGGSHVSGLANHQVSPFYTGNHRPNAFVLARGPGLRNDRAPADGHILDLAPTLCTLLGVDPPPHFQGRVWQEVLP